MGPCAMDDGSSVLGIGVSGLSSTFGCRALNINSTRIAVASTGNRSINLGIGVSCQSSGVGVIGLSTCIGNSGVAITTRGRLGRGTLTSVPMGTKNNCRFVCAGSRKKVMCICPSGCNRGCGRKAFAHDSLTIKGDSCQGCRVGLSNVREACVIRECCPSGAQDITVIPCNFCRSLLSRFASSCPRIRDMCALGSTAL